jgi:GST-like protein
MAAEIELSYWSTPNGWKVAIALEEMGLPYRVRPVNINTGEQFDPEFEKISPNNRMPAIVDPEGPDGDPISVFESGAILMYLARKTGKFYGATERERVAVEEWLMWQMGGLGPMAGQAHHFLYYTPRFDPPLELPYAQDRYRREVARLYGVLDRRLSAHRYAAGDFYSIADMAIWPWISRWERQERVLEDTPHVKRWFEELGARPAVRRGRVLVAAERSETGADAKSREILFQRPA